MGAALGAALISMAMAALPISTRPINLDALAGAWTFETAPHLDTCIIRGQVFATRRGRTLAMQLRATQTCTGGETTDVTERCLGRDAAGVLDVRCQILSSTSANYVADNFALMPASEQQMDGELNDGASWQHVGVRWTRPAPAAVS